MRPHRPPDPRQRNAGRAPGAIVETGQQRKPQHSSDRREFQGRGSRAAEDLAAAFAGPARRFRVIIVTLDRRTEWGRYIDLGAATSCAAKLRRHGMDARIERVPS